MPLSLGTALWLVLSARESADRAEALNRLHTGDLVAARSLLGPPQPWHGAATRAARLVCLTLEGTEPGGELAATRSEEVRAIGLPALMERALADGAPDRCLRLAALATAHGEPLGPLYHAAALMEAGRHREARLAARETAALIPWRATGGRLRQALGLMAEESAGTLVRDRNGWLVGQLTQEGTLQRHPGIREEWLPRPLLERLPKGGRPGLRLSLDLDLCQSATRALGPYRGSIVLLEPGSGALLAAVSDERSRRRGALPAFEQRREPASIAKLITTTAALRAGLDPDEEIRHTVCTGSKRYSGGTLWCAYRAGPLEGLDEALAVSCNLAFADLGIRIGRRALLDEFRRFGFVEGEGAAGHHGRIRQPRGNERQLADLAIGLEATDITPLHAALMAAVFAAGGVMPEPWFVTASDGPLGLSPNSFTPPAGRRVIEERWLPLLHRAMRAVAGWNGTAAGVAPPGLSVAMKTGTAAEWRRGYHVNYIGFVPADDPQVAFCVRVTHQRTSRRVNRAARQVTATLLEDLARRLSAPGSALLGPDPTLETGSWQSRLLPRVAEPGAVHRVREHDVAVAEVAE